ncbi:PQQ-binding-like beta-propeller repeat protein [Salinirubrum litoreum]|uniref:PQQ-binding-like beta-propeller repeat protein n=1 Tax=Salinirubrum litoreum TaxID=1126234 RepID=A0ABD5RCE2_9EURY|nr:PQQ-binding-like beta-propeller repeat protein [Salinirubrum litoreum]
MPSTRRRLLALVGTAGVGSLAGCTGDLLSSGSASDAEQCPPYEIPRWTVNGRDWSPPVVHGNRVLAGTRFAVTGDVVRSRLVSVNADDGSDQAIGTVEGGGFGVPQVHDDTVFVGTGTDQVFALHAETGDEQWVYDAGGQEEYGGGAPGQPAVVGETVVVGISHSEQPDADPVDPADYTHRVVGLDRDSGTERWATAFDDLVWAGPTRLGGSAGSSGASDEVVVTTQGGTVARLDAETGDVRWRTSLDAGIERRALVANDRVVVATVEGSVRELDPASGELGWRGALRGEPADWAQTDEGIVVGDDTGAVTAIRPARDGEQRWQYEAGAPVGGVDARGGVVYALDQRGVVHAISAAEGTRLSRQRYAEGREDDCGWSGNVPRTYGLTASEESLFLAGRWLGAMTSSWA